MWFFFLLNTDICFNFSFCWCQCCLIMYWITCILMCLFTVLFGWTYWITCILMCLFTVLFGWILFWYVYVYGLGFVCLTVLTGRKTPIHLLNCLTVFLCVYAVFCLFDCILMCLCSVLFVWLYFDVFVYSALFVWLYFDVFVQCWNCFQTTEYLLASYKYGSFGKVSTTTSMSLLAK